MTRINGKSLSHISITPIALPTSTPRERAFLDALVQDIGNAEKLGVYADWLEENGDPRSQFLRDFSLAFQSMNVDDFPDFDSVSTEWAHAVGAHLVKAIADHGLSDQRDELLKVIQPTLNFADPLTGFEDELYQEEATFPIGGSKLYGLPDLPTGAVWPTQKDCNCFFDSDSGIDPDTPCSFVCQINFADLQHTQFAKMCPKKGLLSIFSCAEIQRIYAHAYVLFTPEIDGLERVNRPVEIQADEANEQLDAARFKLTETWSLPYPSARSPFPVARIDSVEKYAIVHLSEDIGSNPLGSIGGYTTATMADDPLPGAEWIKLICITNSTGMTLHFCIKKEALAASKFEDVRLVWVDSY